MQSFESRQLTRNIAFARHGENGLAQSVTLEDPENARRSTSIELGERIIEQKDRGASRPLAERLSLEHAQRDRRGSLLPRGSEHAKVAPVECHDQVVAVRSDMRQSPR